MARAINPNATIDYVLKADREFPKEEQTIWKLKFLDASEQSEVEDGLVNADSNGERISLASGSQCLKILRLGLRGWSNFPDENGNPLEPQYRKIAGKEQLTDGSISRIHPSDRRELANAITEAVTVSEDERGE